MILAKTSFHLNGLCWLQVCPILIPFHSAVRKIFLQCKPKHVTFSHFKKFLQWYLFISKIKFKFLSMEPKAALLIPSDLSTVVPSLMCLALAGMNYVNSPVLICLPDSYIVFKTQLRCGLLLVNVLIFP